MQTLKKIILLSVLFMQASWAYVDANAPASATTDIDPVQQRINENKEIEKKNQENYVKARDMKLDVLRQRVELEQNTITCLEHANTMDAAKECDNAEKQAMQELLAKQTEAWKKFMPESNNSNQGS